MVSGPFARRGTLKRAGLSRQQQVGLLTSLAVLCASPLVAFEPAQAAAGKPGPKVAAAVVTERPDPVSAMVTARAQGERVEILSERDEYSTTWANPDGTLTTDLHTGQIRYRDGKGAWRDVDLTLEATADGRVKARRHPHGLQLSGKTAGATDFLGRLSAGKGRELSLGWPKKLPTPVIEGTKATYPEIAPGVDMVMESRRSGFEQHFVITERPTVGMSWDVPLYIKGLTPRVEDDGSISFLREPTAAELAAVEKAKARLAAATGKAAKAKAQRRLDAARAAAKPSVASTIPAAVAWDAAVHPNSGDHVNTAPVKLEIVTQDQLAQEKAAAKAAAAANTAEEAAAPAGGKDAKTAPGTAGTPANNDSTPVAELTSNKAETRAAEDPTATPAPSAEATDAAATTTPKATATTTPSAKATAANRAKVAGKMSKSAAETPAAKSRTKAAKSATKTGKTFLRVTPDAAWISDPARKLPITVDPTYASKTLSPTYDAFVQEGYTSDQSASTDLKLGNNGSGQVARSFLKFGTSGIYKYKIMSASLKLYMNHSWSCSSRYWEVWKTGSASTSTTWTNQPSWTTEMASSNVTKGYSSATCANGWVTQNIKTLVQDWADSSSSSQTLGLRAGSETDEYGWKKFASSETSNDPYISLTYNRAPDKPTMPSLSPVAKYAPPGSTDTKSYTSDTTPTFTSTADDDDENTVKIKFEVHNSTAFDSTTLVSSCTTGYVPDNSSASCTPTAELTSATGFYYVRARANDSFADSASWSSYRTFRVAAVAPTAKPTVTCTGHPNGSWQETLPASSVSCTVAAPGPAEGNWNNPGYVRVSIDGGSETQIKITPSSDPAIAQTTVSVPNSAGGHSVTVRAESPSGLFSPSSDPYQFGYGPLAISAPTEQPHDMTLGPVKIAFAGPPPYTSAVPTAALQWRIAGSGADEASGWNTSTNATLTVENTATDALVNVSGVWNSDLETFDAHADGGTGVTLNADEPVLLEMQTCLTYTDTRGTQCTWNEQPVTVMRVPDSFAAAGPTAPAGPGEVSLRSGEFSMTVTDVTAPGQSGDLGVSRAHTTGIDAADSVFGPGWTSAFDGDTGLGGVQLVDRTRTDATLVLTDATGGVYTFKSPAGNRTTAALHEATYPAVLVDAEDTVGTLSVDIHETVEGSPTYVTFTDTAGGTTVFRRIGTPAANADAQLVLDKAEEPGGLSDVTNYVVDDATGRVTRVIAPSPDTTVANCAAPSSHTAPLLVEGCRSLRLEYGPATTGSSLTRLKAVHMALWDPAKTTEQQAETTMAAYGYDSTGRLTSVTDPRTNLTTTYTYDGTSSRLASLTPPGQDTITLHYAVNGDDAKLTKLTRPRPAGDPTGGTATLASYVYDIPLSGAGLPTMTDTGVAAWGQADAPTYGAAVFGPDHPAPATPGETDWPHASLIYTDDFNGHVLNTAVYGAGNWQLTATDYDDLGNPIRELDARALHLIRSNQLPAGATADQMSTQTVYNTTDLGVGAPPGMLVTDVYGPGRYAVLDDGTTEWVRPRTHYTYDEGAPIGGHSVTHAPFWLVTTEQTTAYDPGAGVDLDVLSLTRNGYAPIQTDDPSGWDLGAPTTVTVDMPDTGCTISGCNNIKRTTRYDALGRVIETRQPKSTGTDAGTRKTTYYSTGSNVSACQNTVWAGLPCKVAPGDGASSVLPTTTLTYTALLAPDITTDTAGTTERSVNIDYDSADRPEKVLTNVTGLASSSPVKNTKTVYATTTGLPVELVELDANGAPTSTKQTMGYDSWGRVVSYTPSGGSGTTTTSYDAASRVATVTDPKGTTTWTYDDADATVRTEYRGLPMKVTVSNGASPVTFTGTYDAAGALIAQTMPGGLTQTTKYDEAGNATGLTYTGQVTEDGTTTPDGAWLAWTIQHDAAGRVKREWTPNGAAITADAGDAIAYDRQYTYDRAGRLLQVNDRTAATTGTALNPSDPASTTTPCEVRLYTFDTNGNRTSLTKRAANTDGSCATSGGTTTNTNYYNAADQRTNGADGTGTYTYDPLGRATTIPDVDTPAGATADDLTIGYYDTDAARTITQNGVTTTYTLDVAGRRLGATTVNGSTTTTLTRHYTDTSDSPGWTETNTGAITRYAASLGRVGATISGAGLVQLGLANPHGDTITTVDVPTTGAATAIDAWSDYTEYGTPRNAAAADTVGGDAGYTWLGTAERGTDDSGLMLMGARLYNPATAQFTSADPVYGGNETAYAYPSDPVNKHDTSGERQYWLRYNIGRFAPTAEVFFAHFRQVYGEYFLKGAPARLSYVGQRFSVQAKLFGYNSPKGPVTVSDITRTGWRFNARFPHFDFPGFIRFTFYKEGGYLKLLIHGSAAWSSSCWAFGAWGCDQAWQKYIGMVRTQIWNPFHDRLIRLAYIVQQNANRRS